MINGNISNHLNSSDGVSFTPTTVIAALNGEETVLPPGWERVDDEVHGTFYVEFVFYIFIIKFNEQMKYFMKFNNF